MLKKILKVSVVLYLGLVLLTTLLVLPFALLGVSDHRILDLIFLPFRIGVNIAVYFIPIVIIISFILLGLDIVKSIKQKPTTPVKKDKKEQNTKKWIFIFMLVFFVAIVIYNFSGEGNFIETGSMSIPRSRHSSILLNDGRVLITGGRSFGDVTNSAEIYTPSTGKFNKINNMNFARASHSMLLLKNGNVLILGGLPNVSDIEIYNVKTNKFSTNGKMLFNNSNYKAVLLNNGKVFILYNINNISIPSFDKPANIAAIYDSKTGKSFIIGKTNLYHSNITLTQLPNGKILICGGEGVRFGEIQNSELYDTVKNKFILTGKPIQVTDGTAVLLNNDKVLLVGNSKADLYDIAKGTFAASKSKANSQYCSLGYCSTVLLNSGKVLVSPIFKPNDDLIKALFLDNQKEKQLLYDPIKDKFTYTKKIWTDLNPRTITVLKNGDVLIAGGQINYKGHSLETRMAWLYKY